MKKAERSTINANTLFIFGKAVFIQNFHRFSRKRFICAPTPVKYALSAAGGDYVGGLYFAFFSQQQGKAGIASVAQIIFFKGEQHSSAVCARMPAACSTSRERSAFSQV